MNQYTNSNNRTMVGNNFSNADMKGAIIQGDHNDLNFNGLPDGLSDLFKDLFDRIQKDIADPEEQEEANADASSIKEAVQDSNWKKAKRFLGRLPQVIQTSDSAIAIGQFLQKMIEGGV